MKVLIIGYGVVGKNMHKIFPNADTYDCNNAKGNTNKDIEYDVAFVCVPTDMKNDGSCDTSIVEQVIKEHSAKVFCIKSTVIPGTTEKLNSIKPCIFSPEYFGGTQHANGGEYNFTILGGKMKLCNIVASAYQEIMTGDFEFKFTDSTTAEVCKYMENAFLAMKVSFCNEFGRIAKCFGIEYKELRELFLMDSRVNRSHTFVYEDAPFYDSHCLNKDVPGIIKACEVKGYSADLLKQMHAINSYYKGVKNVNKV